MADKSGHWIGAIHVGWKGLYGEIISIGVNEFLEMSGSPIKDLLCAVGPAIGKCCFEVSDDLVNMFQEKFDWAEEFINRDFKKAHLNIQGMARRQLELSGLKNHNIEVLDYCTMCHTELFCSFRKEGENAGRQLSAIMAAG